MLTITTYETVLRKRVLHLAAQRPLSTIAHEIQMSRNTLSVWLTERGGCSLTVRTFQKIETWCAKQEAAEATGRAQGQARGVSDGLVNVTIGDMELLNNVNIGVAAEVAAQVSGLSVSHVAALAEQVDRDGATRTVCDTPQGPVTITQN